MRAELGAEGVALGPLPGCGNGVLQCGDGAALLFAGLRCDLLGVVEVGEIDFGADVSIARDYEVFAVE